MSWRCGRGGASAWRPNRLREMKWVMVEAFERFLQGVHHIACGPSLHASLSRCSSSRSSSSPFLEFGEHSCCLGF